MLVLHDSSAGQSVELLQPQEVPFSQTWPSPEVVQLAHEPPPVPHAPPPLPPTHAVPEQQPPLHPVVPAPHTVEQVCVVVLHAWFVGQSVGLLQPQAPVARHALPAGAFTQLVHCVAAPPHTVWLVPD